jgi:hypothetical protein
MPQAKPGKKLLKPYSTARRVGNIFGQTPPGRPVSNLGRYLLRPTPDVRAGVEMLNTQPDILERVHEQYLKAYELPPALQPKYLRTPAVMDNRRAQAISRGWRKPRSRF